MKYVFTPPLILLLFLVTSASAQSFDRLTRPMATLTDPAVMEQILADLLILPPDSLSSIDMVDITANGYGPDDLLILNPTAEVYYLGEFIPPSIRDLVVGWDVEPDYRYEAIWDESAPALLSAHQNEDAPAAIAASCVQAVERHYDGENIGLLLNRDRGVARLEMWSYDPQNMTYGGAEEATACQLNRQRFEMARPMRVSSFRDPGACVEAWTENGQTRTRPCEQ